MNKIKINVFLQNLKEEKGLTDVELASNSGISLDSLRSLRENAYASQLVLLKVVKAYKIPLYKAKDMFSDFEYTRDTLKGKLGEDYKLGKQRVVLKKINVINDKNAVSRTIRVVMSGEKNCEYVKTIHIYSKEFDEFEKSFRLNLLGTGVKTIKYSMLRGMQYSGFINVEDNGSDILNITFLEGDNRNA